MYIELQGSAIMRVLRRLAMGEKRMMMKTRQRRTLMAELSVRRHEAYSCSTEGV